MPTASRGNIRAEKNSRSGFKLNKTLAATMIVLPLTAALCVACSLPRVYRLSVQQGNVITQEMIDGLKPGMTREQVAYVMGLPVIRNPFDDSRWDYVYTLRVPGFVDETVKMSLFFTDDVLTHFTGDFKPSDAAESDSEQADAGESTAPDSAEPSSDPQVES